MTRAYGSIVIKDFIVTWVHSVLREKLLLSLLFGKLPLIAVQCLPRCAAGVQPCMQRCDWIFLSRVGSNDDGQGVTVEGPLAGAMRRAAYLYRHETLPLAA